MVCNLNAVWPLSLPARGEAHLQACGAQEVYDPLVTRKILSLPVRNWGSFYRKKVCVNSHIGIYKIACRQIQQCEQIPTIIIAEAPMDDWSVSKEIEKLASEGPQSALERKLINEYLQKKGYRIDDLQVLPKEEAKQLLKEASSYASLKLAEVEARAKFRKSISGPS